MIKREGEGKIEGAIKDTISTSDRIHNELIMVTMTIHLVN